MASMTEIHDKSELHTTAYWAGFYLQPGAIFLILSNANGKTSKFGLLKVQVCKEYRRTGNIIAQKLWPYGMIFRAGQFLQTEIGCIVDTYRGTAIDTRTKFSRKAEWLRHPARNIDNYLRNLDEPIFYRMTAIYNIDVLLLGNLSLSRAFLATQWSRGLFGNSAAARYWAVLGLCLKRMSFARSLTGSFCR